jgi:hypothetical protein
MGVDRLHNTGVYHLPPSSNIILVITPRRMRWVGHMTCMGERVLVGKPEIKR